MADFPDTPRGHMQREKLQRLKAKQDGQLGPGDSLASLPKKKSKRKVSKKTSTTD